MVMAVMSIGRWRDALTEVVPRDDMPSARAHAMTAAKPERAIV